MNNFILIKADWLSRTTSFPEWANQRWRAASCILGWNSYGKNNPSVGQDVNISLRQASMQLLPQLCDISLQRKKLRAAELDQATSGKWYSMKVHDMES